MEHLHAYWRMEYVAQEKAPKDRRPFVDLPKSDDDKANLIVSREPFTFSLMNRYPYNAGHLQCYHTEKSLISILTKTNETAS